ncbi:hypothetical protein [Nonomuraea sp. NEAU-A123]|uniref:hypothetical protein n=1 Tax=Nonomuraea sp. NEAU-A123 TaxID=2839649 RepID=UPI001BE3D8DA|nr:hypothetical protein [Nonomuraea sp. NEAU-A123]MBT2228507.1 hypothetical protein [Nonomuraea sp. NEAU-A123]
MRLLGHGFRVVVPVVMAGDFLVMASVLAVVAGGFSPLSGRYRVLTKRTGFRKLSVVVSIVGVWLQA